MTIAEKLAVVSHAETDCVVHSAAARAAWRGFGSQLKHAATPPRVVIGGLLTGFLAGMRSSANGGAGLADRLTTTLLQSAIATIGAGFTAGAAADAAARPAASAAASAAAKATTNSVEGNKGDAAIRNGVAHEHTTQS